MNLIVRATGTNEDELLAALEDVANKIRQSKLHSGCTQLAVGNQGYSAFWKFENVDQRVEPVRRGQFAAVADSYSPAVPTAVAHQTLVAAPFPSQR